MGDAMASLTEFVENKWFKLLSRGLMIVGTAASGYIGVRLATYDTRIASVEQIVSDVSSVQGQRAKDGESFQASITNDVAEVKRTVSAMQLDLALAKGILQEMQRRDVADRNGLRLP